MPTTIVDYNKELINYLEDVNYGIQHSSESGWFSGNRWYILLILKNIRTKVMQGLDYHYLHEEGKWTNTGYIWI